MLSARELSGIMLSPFKISFMAEIISGFFILSILAMAGICDEPAADHVFKKSQFLSSSKVKFSKDRF